MHVLPQCMLCSCWFMTAMHVGYVGLSWFMTGAEILGMS